jgi:hypothetical protein
MPANVKCPNCESGLSVPNKLIASGRPMSCPKCGSQFSLTRPKASAAVERDAPPAPQPQLPPIACPWCRGHVSQDPKLAGQVVQCPLCAKQFQMPPSPSASPQPQPQAHQKQDPLLDQIEVEVERITLEELEQLDISGNLPNLLGGADKEQDRADLDEVNARYPGVQSLNSLYQWLQFSCLGCGFIAFVALYHGAFAFAGLLVLVLLIIALVAVPSAGRSYDQAKENRDQASRRMRERNMKLRYRQRLVGEAQSAQCPRCKRLGARELTGRQPIGSRTSYRRERYEEITWSANRQDILARTYKDRDVPVEHTTYREEYRCRHCGHVWDITETYSS